MEFHYNINDIFQSPIVEINHTLIPPGYTGDRRALRDVVSKVSEIINAMGEASASAQGLSKPITTAERLRNSEHKLYFLVDPNANNSKGAVTGMLKTGNKSLYVFDRDGVHYQVSPPCLLDFYIHESKQRNGLGKQLFEHMLQKEKIEPVQMAIDRPSEKLLSFFNKHYSLKQPVKQMNNYVVYDGFFPSKEQVSPTPEVEEARSVAEPKKNSANGLQYFQSPMGRYGAPRPPCSMGQIIHNQSPTIEQRPEPTGVQSMPVTNYQDTNFSPQPNSYQTKSTPNTYYGNYPVNQTQYQNRNQNWQQDPYYQTRDPYQNQFYSGPSNISYQPTYGQQPQAQYSHITPSAHPSQMITTAQASQMNMAGQIPQMNMQVPHLNMPTPPLSMQAPQMNMAGQPSQMNIPVQVSQMNMQAPQMSMLGQASQMNVPAAQMSMPRQVPQMNMQVPQMGMHGQAPQMNMIGQEQPTNMVQENAQMYAGTQPSQVTPYQYQQAGENWVDGDYRNTQVAQQQSAAYVNKVTQSKQKLSNGMDIPEPKPEPKAKQQQQQGVGQVQNATPFTTASRQEPLISYSQNSRIPEQAVQSVNHPHVTQSAVYPTVSGQNPSVQGFAVPHTSQTTPNLNAHPYNTGIVSSQTNATPVRLPSTEYQAQIVPNIEQDRTNQVMGTNEPKQTYYQTQANEGGDFRGQMAPVGQQNTKPVSPKTDLKMDNPVNSFDQEKNSPYNANSAEVNPLNSTQEQQLNYQHEQNVQVSPVHNIQSGPNPDYNQNLNTAPNYSQQQSQHLIQQQQPQHLVHQQSQNLIQQQPQHLVQQQPQHLVQQQQPQHVVQQNSPNQMYQQKTVEEYQQPNFHMAPQQVNQVQSPPQPIINPQQNNVQPYPFINQPNVQQGNVSQENIQRPFSSQPYFQQQNPPVYQDQLGTVLSHQHFQQTNPVQQNYPQRDYGVRVQPEQAYQNYQLAQQNTPSQMQIYQNQQIPYTNAVQQMEPPMGNMNQGDHAQFGDRPLGFTDQPYRVNPSGDFIVQQKHAQNQDSEKEMPKRRVQSAAEIYKTDTPEQHTASLRVKSKRYYNKLIQPSECELTYGYPPQVNESRMSFIRQRS